ncbi:TPA: GPO family capsid scaffolding protein [Vibrio parahaemolyticus]|uniref:GPO family capsid scaffolding protein n=1 Tax=Vibrio parahaemolyticus TaxID=670 RepID=UPI000933ECA2|nr:GPO family capsid scaffolding protein [Vibrio parahaemolyticus]MQF72117.1 phage capsid protein [Vibrio parahaemolyticus]HCE2674510.1 GPO family capsid scaffolding protein [Vibrio parahaemolyticus]HCE2900726.1 GPO family capsid scaffolding protein [Vibrio parahaemolyticus]HCE4884493.1 GPO family capsid scaffolding protein [Vibrio parahaemolyticus]HCE4888583.1 GPO family capsid scaffolding protein [Vibrio parahaemolyticus]
MPKISDWKIIATEGPTVDGRKITREWLSQMAESYDPEEYTALIWPEHRRFYGFGENWGKVVELKAEEKDGKMRLFAKLEPNQYLLDANSKKQKLFTSIEPEPDYKGEGRCYLMGLAATDSPASTGTSLLQFSRKDGETTRLECSHLEEINLEECFTRSERFFSMCNQFFSSGEDKPEIPSEPEDTDVTEEQLQAALKKQFSAFKGELKTELKSELKQEFSQKTPEKPELEQTLEGATVEQFSAAVNTAIAALMEKVSGLETKFNALSKEVPGQEPKGEGAAEDTSHFL